ncbi:MAG: SufS family cysteine desulfurase [Patescibacteria group bacterium]|jgi:cysteine desulfurase/selenocysteine lyase
MPFDADTIRKDFPAFKTDNKQLCYLDSAATTLKPAAVIAALQEHYAHGLSTAHEALYTLGQKSTQQYEAARSTIQQAINAAHSDEIIFTSGTTAGLNLIAETYGRKHLVPGDNVVISIMEHHANLVPWQRICKERGAELRAITLTPQGELDLANAQKLIDKKTKVVAITHASNVLGTVNPISELAKVAHSVGAILIADGAQALAHIPIDVQELDVDFYAASGHKCYGPGGIGFLYGRHELLNDLAPYQVGGRMVEQVTLEKTTFAPPPYRFEAGTPNVGGAIGFAAALTYLAKLPIKERLAHEATLTKRALDALNNTEGVTIVGAPKKRIGVISFTVAGVHPHDVVAVADEESVALRAGDHCAQPLMQFLGLSGTVRLSFGVYSTLTDIDALVRALHRAQKLFA